MEQKTFRFSQSATQVFFDGRFSILKTLASQQKAVVITDENVFAAHETKFKGWNTIILKAGERFKVQATVDSVINQLIELGADRSTILIGVGGGVVTDITGYVAAIFMRGISFGFVPTTLLAMVDASIGGKNGIDVGLYKNMVGAIRQPLFILYDESFLQTLPEKHWKNGFAEIIKHALIKDATLFRQLEEWSLPHYQKNKTLLKGLIKRNAVLKIKVVQADEFETGDRKLLNFGHTLGHALENKYELEHGEAISVGMVFAASLSSHFCSFKQQQRVTKMLQKFGLPVELSYDVDAVFNILQTDKKKEGSAVNFVLLERIGKGVVSPIALKEIYTYL